MDENNWTQEPEQEQYLTPTPEQEPEQGAKPMHAASLVLGILSIVFAIVLPLVGDILGMLSIVLAAVRRRDHRTTAGLVCGIVGLVLSIANHIFTAVFVLPLLEQFTGSGFMM